MWLNFIVNEWQILPGVRDCDVNVSADKSTGESKKKLEH